MNIKYRIFIGMAFSFFWLVLPLFSTWAFCFAINHYWQIETLTWIINSICLILAASAFCPKLLYRIIISLCVLCLCLATQYIWDPIRFFLIFPIAGTFAINLIPEKWNKRAWLMLPYMILRGTIACLSFVLPFNIIDGEFLKGEYLPLLGITYCSLLLILIYDLIIYLISKRSPD